MLETHTLKQHLDQTRQELSQALYQVRQTAHTLYGTGLAIIAPRLDVCSGSRFLFCYVCMFVPIRVCARRGRR